MTIVPSLANRSSSRSAATEGCLEVQISGERNREAWSRRTSPACVTKLEMLSHKIPFS